MLTGSRPSGMTDEQMRTVPGFLSVDHIAIAVNTADLDAHVQLYRTLGFTEIHREDLRGVDQVREVLLQLGESPTRIQLLAPLTSESPVARQIEKSAGRGGLAHIAFRVADIHRAFEYLRQHGFRVIDQAPRPGGRGTTVFFVHPRTTEAAAFGYLFEVVQGNPSASRPA